MAKPSMLRERISDLLLLGAARSFEAFKALVCDHVDVPIFCAALQGRRLANAAPDSDSS
jgi:hypothetical protein